MKLQKKQTISGSESLTSMEDLLSRVPVRSKSKTKEINICINYDYEFFPFTTASYLEFAAERMLRVHMYRKDQIKGLKIDLVINVMPCSKILKLPGVPSCYWEIDCHLVQGKEIDYYDAVDKVFIAQSPFLHLYPAGKTSYLPLACDPERHRPFPEEKKEYDIGFIGNDTYPKRRRLLDQLETKYKVLRTNTKPGVPFSKELSKCKLAFNCSMNYDVNMRFFEALAIGRLLVTDFLPAQVEFAKEGIHYVPFVDWEDLDNEVGYYLKNEKERENMARAGSVYVRRHHTYADRLRKILEVMGWTGF